MTVTVNTLLSHFSGPLLLCFSLSGFPSAPLKFSSLCIFAGLACTPSNSSLVFPDEYSYNIIPFLSSSCFLLHRCVTLTNLWLCNFLWHELRVQAWVCVCVLFFYDHLHGYWLTSNSFLRSDVPWAWVLGSFCSPGYSWSYQRARHTVCLQWMLYQAPMTQEGITNQIW